MADHTCLSGKAFEAMRSAGPSSLDAYRTPAFSTYGKLKRLPMQNPPLYCMVQSDFTFSASSNALVNLNHSISCLPSALFADTSSNRREDPVSAFFKNTTKRYGRR